ncbi:MAG: MaoC family dehydratase [Novosphingobium sp.]|nr:MaoC family dehydratase [Novosphingobium sp.]
MNDEIAAFIEEETGRTYTSGWLLVDQPMIDTFADNTQDWNFLHVDPEKAAETEFGGTIAHGFLTMSLLAPLRADTPRPGLPGLRVGVNYGLDRVRFINPVPSGSRIRAVFTIDAIDEVSPGRFRESMGVTIEIEGQERPAVVANWLSMFML